MNKYTVEFERDESGWWIAQLKEEPAAITQGRTLGEARRRIREALAAILDDEEKANSARFVDKVTLPTKASNALQRARNDRERLALDTSRASASLALAVAELVTKVGLSSRDAGELIGITHQRVHQLTNASATRPRRSAHSRRSKRSAGRETVTR